MKKTKKIIVLVIAVFVCFLLFLPEVVIANTYNTLEEALTAANKINVETRVTDKGNGVPIEERAAAIAWSNIRDSEGKINFAGMEFTYDPDSGHIQESTNQQITIYDNSNRVIAVIPDDMYYSSTTGELFLNIDTLLVPSGLTEIELKWGDTVEHTITMDISEQRTNVSNPGILGTLWGLIVDTKNEIIRTAERLMNDLLLAILDGILYMLSDAVGEPVSVDRIVFNQIDKLSINYWEERRHRNS